MRAWLPALLATPLLSLAGPAQAAPPEKSSRPNILFIMSDDHAAHAIGSYGSKVNQTPNIDRLAKEGMRFANAFCTNAICGPSRAVILTGKYSHLNGFRTNTREKFDGAQPHVAKMLQTAGYQTAIIGKWHLVSEPTGFDHWEILPGQGRYIDPVFIGPGGAKTVAKGYVTDITTDKTIDYLEKRDRSKPFFLMCHHKAPHREWTPDDKHRDMFKDREIPEPPTLRDDYKGRSRAAAETEMTVAKHFTPTDMKQPVPEGLSEDESLKWHYRRYMQDYLACVQSVDDNIGRLLDYLDKSGLADNTIVVYTSDQGFFLGDHGWYDKRFMYEEALRMPLLVRAPGRVAPGTVCEKIALNLDFAETFLDYAGAPIPSEMQGKSLRPLLAGQPPKDWRTSMYYHYYEFPQPHHVQPHYGVRTETHKLIRFPQIDAWELFDLKADPHELKSIHDEPAAAETLKKLKEELERLRKEYKDEEVVAAR